MKDWRNTAVWTVVIALLVIAGVMSLRGVGWVHENVTLQARTLETLLKLEVLQGNLVDAETGQRGYLLTGDDRFLEPYNKVIGTIERDVAELRELVREDGTVQQSQVDRLHTLIRARQAILSETIALQQSGNPSAAVAIVKEGRSRQLMQSIRRVINALEEEELADQRRFNNQFESSLRDLGILVIGGALLAVLAASGAAYRVSRMAAMVRRKSAFQGALLDNVDVSIISADTEGAINSINIGAEKMLGYSAAELLGARPAVFHDRDEIIAHAATLTQLLGRPIEPGFETFVARARQGEVDRREWTYVRKDGTRLPVLLSVSAMRDNRGAITGFLGVARDITEAKNAEEALRRQRDCLDLALAGANLAMWDTDFRTGQISLDERWATMIGEAPGPIITTRAELLERVPDYDQQRLLAAAADAACGRTAEYQVEHQVRTKSGEWRWIQSHGKVVERDAAGRALRMIGINADINVRKRTERHLIAAKNAAELANRAKDAFLATMSHEIRTPLGGVLGMLEMLSFTPLDENQRETLQAARESGQNLLRILNDILDWSKIEEGKLDLAPRPTSLPRLVAEVVRAYAHVASANSVTLEHHVDPRLSAMLIVDPLRLSQVLNNFVSNALKFTSEGRVEVRAELLGRSEGMEQVRLSVKDTGIGIDESVQQRLFQMYSQQSADTARMYGGTGLGLAICHRLSEMLHGHIDLESAPGRGSTFSITLSLPIAAPAVKEMEHLPAVAGSGSVEPLFLGSANANAPWVLVADDHSTNRQLLALQLRMLGVRVEVAQNGQQALAMWQEGSFSLVITDCHMPQMDGYALTRAIRKSEIDEARPRTPIFAWTANVLAKELEHCHAAGMDEVLIKPVEIKNLRELLAKWLPPPQRVSRLDTEYMYVDATQTTPLGVAEIDKIAANDVDKAEILRDFIAQTQSDFIEMETAMNQSDLPGLVRIAHRMKGASRMVGAYELIAACAVVEQAARQGERPGVEPVRLAMQRLKMHLAGEVSADRV